MGLIVGNLASNAKAGTKTAMQLPIPASPFNYLILMIRSDSASEEVSLIVYIYIYIYEKPPLLWRRTWLSDAACVEYLVDLIYKPVVHVLLSIKIRLLFILNHRKATKTFYS